MLIARLVVILPIPIAAVLASVVGSQDYATFFPA
jgi:hypothetical protein